jgi:formylmethanofuran dehydrogenase subunit E
MPEVEFFLCEGEMLKCDYCGEDLYRDKVRFIYDVFGYKVICSTCWKEEH